MAVLGYTKLEAVNEMLVAIGEMPVDALDTGGTSDEAEAERILDVVDRQVQALGWPENTELCVSYTPSGVGNSVTVGPDVLAIKAAGPTQHRKFVLRGDTVYDADPGRNTTNFGGTTPIFLDRVVKLSFENLAPQTKEAVVARARAIFQRRKKGSERDDAWLQYEMLLADYHADRNTPSPNGQPLPNMRPLPMPTQERTER